MFITFIFMGITIVLLIKLNDILGIHMGFEVKVKEDDSFDEKNSTIEEVKNTENNRVIADFVPKDFIEKAKKAFEIIFVAYSKDDKETLKQLLAPKLYSAFSMAIDDRSSRKETLEGILVRFISAEIVDSYTDNDTDFITVKFVTEQSNTLKNNKGEVLEGNSDFIEKRTDTWVFSRKKSSDNKVWFLYEIIED